MPYRVPSLYEIGIEYEAIDIVPQASNSNGEMNIEAPAPQPQDTKQDMNEEIYAPDDIRNPEIFSKVLKSYYGKNWGVKR